MKKLSPFRALSLQLFLTVFGLFLFSSTASSNANQCGHLFSQNETVHSKSTVLSLIVPQWKSLDSYAKFNYASFQNILFLNDAGKGGRALSQTVTDRQLVVSSDFNISEGVNVKIDNNQLPFKENAFDLIIMNRGLCPCRGTVACGGIDTKYEPMKKFLLAAIHTLDKNNPNSLALFTGYYFPGLFNKTVPELWKKIADEVQAMYPQLQIAILTSNTGGEIAYGFVGLAVSTSHETPIAEQVNQLVFR